MNDKELQFYYPNRFYKSRPHLKKIIDKIIDRKDFEQYLNILSKENVRQSKFEPNIEFDQERLNLRIRTEVENIYTLAKFRRSGSNIFSFSKELLQMLDKTDVGNIEFKNIRHPFKEYYISIRNLNRDVKGKYMDYKYKLDGVYISNEIKNSIILHLAGFNEQKKTKNWYYFPDFSNINTLDFKSPENSVDFALNELFTTLKEKTASFKFLKDDNLRPNLENTFLEISDNIRLIINCILFLSTHENIDSEYPSDIPGHLLSKYRNAKTKRQIKNSEQEIRRSGFSKIKFAGYSLKTPSKHALYGSVSPHWRRGHWRKQPFGKEFQEIKLVWIKPTIVRKDKGKPDKGRIYEV